MKKQDGPLNEPPFRQGLMIPPSVSCRIEAHVEHGNAGWRTGTKTQLGQRLH